LVALALAGVPFSPSTAALLAECASSSKEAVQMWFKLIAVLTYQSRLSLLTLVSSFVAVQCIVYLDQLLDAAASLQ